MNRKKEERGWYLVNAADFRLGRMATRVARILMGKHKPFYSPNLDQADYVIVINASKVKVSGHKREEKYYNHSTGYIGHLKSKRLGELLKNNPTAVIRKAVSGMIPNNRLKKEALKHLKIFAGEKNPLQKENLIEIKD